MTRFIFVTLLKTISFSGEAGYEAPLSDDVHSDARIVTNVFPASLKAELSIVHDRTGDFVLSIDQQQFFIRYIGGVGYRKMSEADLTVGQLFPGESVIALRLRKRDTIRLSTTLADKLGEVLFNQGLESFLSLDRHSGIRRSASS